MAHRQNASGGNEVRSSRRADWGLIYKSKIREWGISWWNEVLKFYYNFDIHSGCCGLMVGGILLATLPPSFSKNNIKQAHGRNRKPKMDLNTCTLVGLKYQIYSTHPPYTYELFPWAQHYSPPWQDSLCLRRTNRNWTQKASTYNSLECEVKKKGLEVKSENLNTIHAKNCLHRGMWNVSMIWQNSAYVDAFSNPFMQ